MYRTRHCCSEICQLKTHLPTTKKKGKASHPALPVKPPDLKHENTIVTFKSKSNKLRRDAQPYNSARSGPLTSSEQNIHRWTCQDDRGVSEIARLQSLKMCSNAFHVPRNPTVSILLSKDTFSRSPVIFLAQNPYMYFICTQVLETKLCNQSPSGCFSTIVLRIHSELWNNK